MSDREIGALLGALALLVVAGVFVDECRQRARAEPLVRPVAAEEWTPAAREAVTRVAELETANWRDWPAIAGVLLRRTRMTRAAQGWDLAGQSIAYSHLLGAWGGHCPPRRKWSPRMRRILTKPSPKAYAVIDAWAAGRLPDPCPMAVHWGAPSLFSPLPVARCFVPHWEMANTFRDPAGS